jgi:hypothetical protein
MKDRWYQIYDDHFPLPPKKNKSQADPSFTRSIVHLPFPHIVKSIKKEPSCPLSILYLAPFLYPLFFVSKGAKDEVYQQNEKG